MNNKDKFHCILDIMLVCSIILLIPAVFMFMSSIIYQEIIINNYCGNNGYLDSEYLNSEQLPINTFSCNNKMINDSVENKKICLYMDCNFLGYSCDIYKTSCSID